MARMTHNENTTIDIDNGDVISVSYQTSTYSKGLQIQTRDNHTVNIHFDSNEEFTKFLDLLVDAAYEQHTSGDKYGSSAFASSERKVTMADLIVAYETLNQAKSLSPSE